MRSARLRGSSGRMTPLTRTDAMATAGVRFSGCRRCAGAAVVVEDVRVASAVAVSRRVDPADMSVYSHRHAPDDEMTRKTR